MRRRYLGRCIAVILFGVVGALGLFGESGQDCKLFAPTWFAGGGTLASNMLTYTALWCGFVFVILQLRFVSKWMKRKFVTGPKGIRSISATWDATYGPTIERSIDKRIKTVSSLAWWVFSWTYLYLALLTGWPERCTVFEERVLVLLISNIPVLVLFIAFQRTRSEVKVLMNAAEMSKNVPPQLGEG